VREVYRRSGGRTPTLGAAELAAMYRPLLNNISSINQFWHAPLDLDLDALLPHEERVPYLELPDRVSIRGRDVDIDYDVEPGPLGVARLRLPEKMARTLVEEELPVLDRPVRFTVLRGQRGTVRASTLDELQDLLDRPWSPPPRADGDGRPAPRRQPKDGRHQSGKRRRRR
jgi:hypothetical protein